MLFCAKVNTLTNSGKEEVIFFSMFEKRYAKNGTTVNPEEQAKLKGKTVLVAGCGGLGGYVIEMLARVGVGSIIAVDPDIFDETNLNRQLLSDEKSLGKFKALKAVERCRMINSEVKVISKKVRIDRSNSRGLLDGCHLAVDALDNIQGRLDLQAGAIENNIPLVHGAISGWYGQVALCLPGDNLYGKIYPEGLDTQIDSRPGNPSFSPAVVAGFQVSEVLKVLLGKGEILKNKLLFLDMLTNSHQIVEL